VHDEEVTPVLTKTFGQATTGVVAFARPETVGGSAPHGFPRTQALMVTNDPYPVLGEPLSSPPV
jgi:hypothetical protein